MLPIPSLQGTAYTPKLGRPGGQAQAKTAARLPEAKQSALHASDHNGPRAMTAFRRTLRSAADLADAGLIPPDRAAEIAAVERRYAVAVTPAMATLIDPTNPNDPIAQQFLPDARELTRRP